MASRALRTAEKSPRRLFALAALTIAALLGAGVAAGAEPPAPAQAAGPNLLANPGFENGLAGWSTVGTQSAAIAQTTNPRSGSGNLAHYSSTAWSVNSVQTLTGLTKGTYVLSAWTKNWGVTGAGLQAYSCGDATQSVSIPPSTAWRKTTVIVSVLSPSCTVGIWSNSTGQSLVADDFSFTRITPGTGGTMPVGGDITYRRMTASMGGKWSDAAGTQRDVLDVLAPNKFNLARIRIYNEPGNLVTYNGSQVKLQPGWQDLADAVQNAKDAKARGMKIFISLHYSDFWTNPSIQLRPNDWNGFTQAQLETATYDFTRTVMTTLQSNGVTPDYISIGNEINDSVMDVSRISDPANYYGLLNKGAAAVRSVSTTTKVAIHLTTPSTYLYSDWISGATTYNLDYDILGMSLYPFWTNLSIASLANFATWVNQTSGKQTMVVETGYPWTLSAQDPGEQTYVQLNNLDPDGPENYGATQAGQLRYMQEYLRSMSETGIVAAVSYWDPIWIDLGNGAAGADSNGWIVGGDVEVEDTTFFDYSNPHKPTQGLTAFKTW